ncbi:hypothetical protein ACFLZV_04350 [Candidatus Margulisiibacteriota bacterium]
MEIRKLCYLGYELNMDLDSGKNTEIKIDEITDKINDGSIFDFLSKQLGNTFYKNGLEKAEKDELISNWKNNVENIDEKRKYGIYNNGLNLLIAYLFQGIVDRAGEINKPGI